MFPHVCACMCTHTHISTKQKNSQDCWVFGLCLSSGILKNTMFWKLDLFLPLGERVGDTYSVGSIDKKQHGKSSNKIFILMNRNNLMNYRKERRWREQYNTILTHVIFRH